MTLRIETLAGKDKFDLPQIEGETIRELHLRITEKMGIVDQFEDVSSVSLHQHGRVSVSDARFRHRLVSDELKLDEPLTPSTSDLVHYQ